MSCYHEYNSRGTHVDKEQESANDAQLPILNYLLFGSPQELSHRFLPLATLESTNKLNMANNTYRVEAGVYKLVRKNGVKLVFFKQFPQFCPPMINIIGHCWKRRHSSTRVSTVHVLHEHERIYTTPKEPEWCKSCGIKVTHLRCSERQVLQSKKNFPSFCRLELIAAA